MPRIDMERVNLVQNRDGHCSNGYIDRDEEAKKKDRKNCRKLVCFSKHNRWLFVTVVRLFLKENRNNEMARSQVKVVKHWRVVT